MKKLVALLLTFLLIILTGCEKVEVTKIDDDIKTDNIKFSDEYKKVSKNNIYEYSNYEEIYNTISKKTGIIYLGFPTCGLCTEVAPVLNDVAKINGINKILYYNFKDIRENNTKEYQDLINLLGDNLKEDSNGNKVLTAPTIIFVNKGEIVGTYTGYLDSNDEEILPVEKRRKLKQTLSDLIDKTKEEKTTTTTTEVIEQQ